MRRVASTPSRVARGPIWPVPNPRFVHNSLSAALILSFMLPFVWSGAEVSAQDWLAEARPTLGATLGTAGIGLEAGLRHGDRLGARLGLSWIPFSVDIDEDDVTGTAEPPSPIVRATLDFFPRAGTFHLSAGLHHVRQGVSVEMIPTDSIEVGDNRYAPEEAGRFLGEAWGRTTAPYLGFGWQGRGGRLQFYSDLGVAFTGSPSITVRVTGPLAGDSEFMEDLRSETREAEDDVSDFRFLPHLALGLRYRIGGSR